jgi:DNA-directed RNA polymerase subunit N (RpoN/RPB10)
MYPYILCNCGFSIGDKYDAFKALRVKAYEKHFNATGKHVDAEMFSYSEEMRVDLRDAFEQLGVKQQCCKARLLTLVEFKTLY